MSAPVPGRHDRLEPDDLGRPADRVALAAQQAARAVDRTAVAADQTGTQADETADHLAGGHADVIVMPVEAGVEVPTPVPVVVAAPGEAAQPWTGTIIDAVPTTADDIAALVLAVPDVVRLHAGRFGEVATYLPGRRVTGVKLGDDLIEVHVVVAGQVPIQQSAQAIHEAVATVVATPVHVFVEDVTA